MFLILCPQGEAFEAWVCAEGACLAMAESSTVAAWSGRRSARAQAAVVYHRGTVPVDKIQGSNRAGCRISSGSSRTPDTFAKFQQWQSSAHCCADGAMAGLLPAATVPWPASLRQRSWALDSNRSIKEA